MNVHDSERMTGMMADDGFEYVNEFDDADIAIINTCAVREKPERKLFGELGRLRKMKQSRPSMIIGVTGCMAPRDMDIIRARAPYVDLIIGPRSLHRLPDMVRKIELQRKPIDAIDLFDDPTPITPIRRASSISAWVDVMFGCDYACSYCAVPTARGGEVSRKPDEILTEIDELVSVGYKEVTLLGQTVNGYGRDFHYKHPDNEEEIKRPPLNPPLLRRGGKLQESSTENNKIDFLWLLQQIDERYPSLRVRFTSPHPQLFNNRFLEQFANLSTLCEHMHLPLQSADNEVLKRMKRSYTIEKYMEIVERMRKAVPSISVTTDIIVGFPGETEEQFQRTLDAYEQIAFDQAFMFIYSPRRHTEAIKFEDEAIPHDVAQKRLARLIDLANDIARQKNQELVGETYELLVEGISPKNPDRLSGRTRNNKTVVFEGESDLIGQLVKVKAEEGFLWGFKGRLVG